MGSVKKELEGKESAWSKKAEVENIRCEFCSEHICYDEREVYFDTKKCSLCQYQLTK